MSKLSILSFFILFFSFFISVDISKAASYTASELLGQVDYVHGSSNRPVIETGLYNPDGIVLDSTNHRLFVSDGVNNRILVFSLDVSNNIISETPSYVIGQDDFLSNGSGTAANRLNYPRGLDYNAVSSSLFVADYQNDRVLVFDVSTSTMANGMSAIAVIGQTNFNTYLSYGSVSEYSIFSPVGVAYDSVSNTLYATDFGTARVLAYDLNNLLTTSTPAFAVIGKTSFTSYAGALTSQTSLSGPQAIVYVVASNTLYVGDGNTDRILVYNLNNLLTTSTPASAVIGQDDFESNSTGLGANRLQDPRGFAYNSVSNTLYVSDSNNNRVLVYDLNNLLTTSTLASAVIGQSDFSAGSSGLSQSSLYTPVGVAYNSVSNTVFVVDGNNHRVLVFDASGGTQNAQGILGQPNYTSSASNRANTREDSVYAPTFSAIDTTNHRLFVSDSSNNRVLGFDLDANDNIISDTASYVIGQTNFSGSSSANSQTGLNNPRGLLYNSISSTLFISDSGNNRVLIFNLSSLLVTSTPASAVIGQENFDTNPAATSQVGMSAPYALSYGSVSNTLFVSDFNNNRVLVYDLNNLLTTSTPASAVIGQVDFVSSANADTQVSLMNPKGLSYSATSNTLFVADTFNHRVLVYDLNNLLTTSTPASAVIGQVDFTSQITGTSQTALNQPYGLGFDSNENVLFVNDSSNHRVLVYDLNNLLTTSTPASAVIGQVDFTSGSSGLTQSSLSSPAGLTYNSINNTIYISDPGNNRVLEFKLVYISNPSTLSTTTVGSVYPTTTISAFNSQSSLSYSLFSGSLPSGLSFNTSTGVISGTPLETGTSTFVIQASDTFGDSSVFLNRKTFTIYIWSANPTSPAVSLVTTSTVTFSWGGNSNPNSTIYRITGDNGFAAVTTTATTTDLTGLTPNTSYTFNVQSQNANGSYNSVVSSTATTTLANTPSSVSATANSVSQITVSWFGDAAEYYVENVTASTNSGWVTSTSQVFSPLTCGTLYSFRVKGRNLSSVETSFSSSVSATTNSCPVSGGGGGGSFVPSAPSTPAVLAPAILNQIFSVTGSTEVKVGNVSHKVQVNKIDVANNQATFTVESTPIIFTLKVSEEKVLDTDGDKENDIRIKLNSISNEDKTVNLTIFSIVDLQFTINNFSLTTIDRDVTLRFNSPDASQMAISESPDFTGASFESYQKVKKWKLSAGIGIKKIYVKLRTAQGGVRTVYSSINLVEKIETSDKVKTAISVPVIPQFIVLNPSSKVIISPVKKLQYAPNSSVAYSYTFKNEDGKTLKIKVIRQVVDANGKIVNKVTGSASVVKGKIFKSSNASNILGSKLTDGIYTIQIKVTDTKGNLLDENGFDVTISKPIPVAKKAPVKKK